MVAPLNDLTAPAQPQAQSGTADPNQVGMPPTPDLLPDGSPVRQPMDSYALAESLNNQLAQSEQNFAAQQQSIAQLAQTQQQSLDTFTTLAQSIQSTQQQQNQRFEQQQAEQQRQAQQLPAPQYTAAEQQLMTDQPELQSLVQKQAAYLAGQAAQTMNQNTQSMFEQERRTWAQEMNQLREANQEIRGTVQSRFNSEVEHFASELQIDLANAGNDPNFAAWANRPSGPFSTRTIRQELQDMSNRYDTPRVKEALQSFVQEFYPDRLPGGAALQQPQPGQVAPHQQQGVGPGQMAPPPVAMGPNGQPIDPRYFTQQPATSASGYPYELDQEQQQQYQQPQQQPYQQPQQQQPQQQQLAGQPGGAATRAPANPQQPAGPDINQQLNTLIGQQNELRVRREGQHISGEQFDTELAALTSQIFQLRNQQLEQLNQQPT